MKKPWVAFLCNFLLAGAGFAYLGKWMWAVADLFVTLLIGLDMNMTKLWNSRLPKTQPTT